MKTLYSCDFALDILSLHLKIPDVLFDAVQLLTEYDCETVGGSIVMDKNLSSTETRCR